MKCLIDTHVLLWSIGNSTNLSKKAREWVSQHDVYTSAASWWEISIKYSIGKLKLGNKTPDDLWAASQAMNFASLPIQARETNSFYKLELLTKDPFDRILVWQAIKNDLPLVSKDRRLAGYERYGLQLIW